MKYSKPSFLVSGDIMAADCRPMQSLVDDLVILLPREAASNYEQTWLLPCLLLFLFNNNTYVFQKESSCYFSRL